MAEPITIASTSPAWRSSLASLTRNRKILVLSPHPDDESLACGGLLAACFAHHGAQVVCLTDGGMSHPGSLAWPRRQLAQLREEELSSAVKTLGGQTSDLCLLRYPDTRAPRDALTQRRLAEMLIRYCQRHSIRCVFTASADDAHIDHEACFEIAAQVKRLAPWLTLYEYSVWSRWLAQAARAKTGWLSFATSPWSARKRAALACYRSQQGLVIDDDPQGFIMPRGFVDFFADNDEHFREVRHVGGV